MLTGLSRGASFSNHDANIRCHRFRQDRSSCRFFFPWPYQPYQVYDANSERVALQRRLPDDDAWCVPHNLALLMFSPSSVNVICFDPMRGLAVRKQGRVNGVAFHMISRETQRGRGI